MTENPHLSPGYDMKYEILFPEFLEQMTRVSLYPTLIYADLCHFSVHSGKDHCLFDSYKHLSRVVGKRVGLCKIYLKILEREGLISVETKPQLKIYLKLHTAITGLSGATEGIISCVPTSWGPDAVEYAYHWSASKRQGKAYLRLTAIVPVPVPGSLSAAILDIGERTL